MASLNPSIILAQELPNLAETYYKSYDSGRKAAVEDAAIRRSNKLNQALAAMPKGANTQDYLTQQGFADEGLDYGKKQAEIDKISGESQKLKTEQALKDLEVLSQVNRGFKSIPKLNKATMLDHTWSLAQQGILRPDQVNALQMQLKNINDDPESLNAWVDQMEAQGTAAKEYYGGLVPDANAQLSAQTQANAQDITAQNNLFNQDLNTKQFGLDQEKAGLDAAYKGQQIAIAQQKQFAPSQQKDADIQKMDAGKEQLNTLLNQARSEIKALSDLDALSSTDKGVLSNTGSKIANSAIGQAIGSTIGTKEQTHRDNLNNLKPRILNAIMSATGASAKSMDSNVELKLALQSLGDVSQSKQSLEKIIDNLESVYAKGLTNDNQGGAASSWQKPDDWEQFLKERGK